MLGAGGPQSMGRPCDSLETLAQNLSRISNCRIRGRRGVAASSARLRAITITWSQPPHRRQRGEFIKDARTAASYERLVSRLKNSLPAPKYVAMWSSPAGYLRHRRAVDSRREPPRPVRGRFASEPRRRRDPSPRTIIRVGGAASRSRDPRRGSRLGRRSGCGTMIKSARWPGAALHRSTSAACHINPTENCHVRQTWRPAASAARRPAASVPFGASPRRPCA